MGLTGFASLCEGSLSFRVSFLFLSATSGGNNSSSSFAREDLGRDGAAGDIGYAADFGGE